jgi:poly-gamma-glutamate capsule biosynthesis protein CapA/YwtB (metallophosphatase superfamily)
MPRKLLFILILLPLSLLLVAWNLPHLLRLLRRPVGLRGSANELTIAATGDTLLLRPMPSTRTDLSFRDALAVLQGAGAALTNLDENLLDPAYAREHVPAGVVAWPHGSLDQADTLRNIGFTVISLANNHAFDYGVEGLQQTSTILERAGLHPSGSGRELAQARSPLYLGSRDHNRIAVLSVATSTSAEARATFSHGEIVGRAGISAIRYTPDVTLDPTTFSTLRLSNAAAREGAPSDADHFMLSGTPVRKGERTQVEFVPDPEDCADLFSRIRTAHANADAVVVMLHSHEPANRSREPAHFVEQLARRMIDAGANLVIGHGPHQLRGIEVYRGGAILYSLGNFFFDYGAVNPQSADVYDSGADLYQLALGNFVGAEPLTPAHYAEPMWWESAIALATFKNGTLSALAIRPIDLGVDLPLTNRGIPRLATGQRADHILERLSDLSASFGTKIRNNQGIGLVDLTTYGGK